MAIQWGNMAAVLGTLPASVTVAVLTIPPLIVVYMYF